MIDTHCHIDQYANPKIVLNHCEKANVTVLAMTNLPSHFELGYPHILHYKRIRIALGMHPLYAENHNKEFPIFLKNLHKTSYIGEVGLDFSPEGFRTKEIQLSSFIKILDAISNEKKILSLHSRRAEREVLNLLTQKKIKGAIFHWYSGSLELVDKIANAGYYFSVNSAMTKSENGKKIINRIPLDKLLTETDGPFIKIEGREMTPTDIDVIINEIANIKKISSIETSNLVKKNFNQIIQFIK